MNLFCRPLSMQMFPLPAVAEPGIVHAVNFESFCDGCSRVQNGLFGKRDRARLDKKAERPYTVQLHGSFALLSACAKKCLPCRVFQRAVLLEQCTYRSARGLEDCREPVYATLYGDLLCITVRKGAAAIVEAPVSCKKQTVCALAGPLRLSANPTRDRGACSPIDSLKKWLRECETQHGPSCLNLRWSNQNPTWLIHIQPDNTLRLVPARDLPPVDYVALSYCWGDPAEMDEASWQRVRGNRSKRDRIPQRRLSFSPQELSRTLQHSVRIAREVGLRHVWVDSVCIPQGSD